MASDEVVESLKTSIKAALEFKEKEMIRRTDWGSMNFDEAKKDLDVVFDIIENLSLMPIVYLPENIAISIQNEVANVETILQRIDKFSLEGDPSGKRVGIISDFHSRREQIIVVAGNWLPFLAYQKGDVSKNINELSNAVKKAQTMYKKAEETISGHIETINEIITKAREASGKAGAAVFTEDFNKEATKARKTARWWLISTGVLAAATLAVAFKFLTFLKPDMSTGESIQLVSTRIILLAVMFTSTLWCGRIYKALMHQAAINRHRALGLQTFQAFSAASENPQTKDAVLLETTRSIFSSQATGYLDIKDERTDSGTKVIEIAKMLDLEKKAGE